MDVVSFVTAWKPVGIKQVNASVTSTIPNPAQHSVTFSNNLIENGTIEICNAMGQVVLTMNYANHMAIDIKDFASGVYSVRISNDVNSSVTKFIKE